MATPVNPFASPTSEAQPAAFVQADCFRGLTISGFVDRFRIYEPNPQDLIPRITHFYRQAKAPVRCPEFPLRFVRGNLLSSLLGPEKWAQQEIVVHRIDQPRLELRIEYRVFMVLPIRPPVPTTLREVTRLALELEAINPH